MRRREFNFGANCGYVGTVPQINHLCVVLVVITTINLSGRAFCFIMVLRLLCFYASSLELGVEAVCWPVSGHVFCLF